MNGLKTIGILGGMSWESTAVYYRRLNQLVQERLGGVASASLLLHSFDFATIERLQHEEEWDQLADVLTSAARGLRSAGADFLLIATNTMHLLADAVADGSGLPVLHIADAAADAVRAGGYSRVGLLGTRFTMERGFYAERISRGAGAECVIPEEQDRVQVHRIIYQELCTGAVLPESRATVAAIIDRLTAAGAQAVILGCTELPLLVRTTDSVLPVLDTTELHVQAAVRRALS